MLIYGFVSMVNTIFVSIYIFQQAWWIQTIIRFYILIFIAWFFWFAGLWTLIAYYRNNIKRMLLLAYILYIVAFIVLITIDSQFRWTVTYACFSGVGMWLFRFSILSYELNFITDEQRDFYALMVQLWLALIVFIGSALATALLWLWKTMMADSPYLILFTTTTLVALMSIFIIRQLPPCFAFPIKKSDLLHFFSRSKHKYHLTYFFFSWIVGWVTNFFFVIVWLVILQSDIKVGVYQTAMNLIARWVLMLIGMKSSIKRRKELLGIFTLLMILNMWWLTLSMTAYWLVIYGLIEVVIKPVFHSTMHVYNLTIMDEMKGEWCNYSSSMVLREMVLLIARLLFLWVLRILFQQGHDTITILKIWLYLFCFTYLATRWTITLYHKNIDQWHNRRGRHTPAPSCSTP